jgi:hypothetical protein
MLGERTGGTDSTRITYAQYFFDAETMTGNMYVSWRGRKGRKNGNRYVYFDMPVSAARNFYDSLSKGKNANYNLDSYAYSHSPDGRYFAQPPATPLGERIQHGAPTPNPDQPSLFD